MSRYREISDDGKHATYWFACKCEHITVSRHGECIIDSDPSNTVILANCFQHSRNSRNRVALMGLKAGGTKFNLDFDMRTFEIIPPGNWI